MNRQLGFPILLGTRWVLLAGFGGLLLLLAALAFYSVVVLDKVERVDREETRRFIAQAGSLHQLRSRLMTVSADVRDYLLNRDRSGIDSHRRDLASAWRVVESGLTTSESALLPGEGALITNMRADAATYWHAVTATFPWTGRELDNEGYDVLSKQLDPARARILTALDDVRRIDEDHFRGAFAASTEQIAILKTRLRGTIVAALALGLGLAAFSIWQVIRLESVAQSRYQALTEAYQEQGRLAERVLEVQEQERKSLARELHDEVSQSLGAMLVDLSSLTEQNVHLDSAKRIGNEVLNSIRNICLLLRPSMLDDLGLIAALHWQARETLRRSGISVSITADDADMELPDAYRTTVYRVVQEALQNVMRHSGARHAQIVIRREQERLAVMVQDDGKGFDPEVTRGLGILGMQERVNRLDGTLQINSEPGKGTIVSLLLPLRSSAGQAIGSAA